jgi:hypothetical protein
MVYIYKYMFYLIFIVPCVQVSLHVVARRLHALHVLSMQARVLRGLREAVQVGRQVRRGRGLRQVGLARASPQELLVLSQRQRTRRASKNIKGIKYIPYVPCIPYIRTRKLIKFFVVIVSKCNIIFLFREQKLSIVLK